MLKPEHKMKASFLHVYIMELAFHSCRHVDVWLGFDLW